MGRPRKVHPVEPLEDDEEQATTSKKKRTVVYSGPPGQVNYDFVSEVGGEPETGEEYEVSGELADRLIRSSRHWEEA